LDPVLVPSDSCGDEPIVLRGSAIDRFDRGNGVSTLPYVGKWNLSSNQLTTGIKQLPPGSGVSLHSHDVEETVIVLLGHATAIVADDQFILEPLDATWVPAGTRHCFLNRSDEPVHFYWTHGGRDVTRTITATGETVAHLSARDQT
jgi:HTH-type transcriptional regulator, repressor for puuD